MRAAVNSSPTHRKPNLALAMGFCTNSDAEVDLIAFGIPAERVWNSKREGETLDWVIESDRERHLPVYVAESLTCFGEGRDEIFGRTDQLEMAGIPIRDIRNPRASLSMLLKAAQKSLSASNGMKDKRTARKRGRMGGVAKREAAQLRREAADPHGLAKKVWQRTDIPLRIRTELLAGICSAATARRIYA